MPTSRPDIGLTESLQSDDEVALQVRKTLGFAWLQDWDLLEITGPDAARFLQNRLSNDVLSLEPGQGQMNAVLDRQAKIQGIFSLHRTTDGFWMLIDARETQNATANIEKFRILEQVTIHPLQKLSTSTRQGASISIFSIQGPESGVFLSLLATQSSLPETEYAWTAVAIFGSPAVVVQRSFSGETGFLLLVETLEPEAFWMQFKEQAVAAQGVEMSASVRNLLRVEAGLPRWGDDYNFDTLLPETGLERETVSYSKGCYLGQETVARIKTYGILPQAMAGLVFEKDSSLPAMHSACLLEGRSVGTIQSVAFSPILNRPIAMAYLGKAERIPEKMLNLEIAGQPYIAKVVLLPFYDARMTAQSGQALLDLGLKRFSEGFDQEAIRLLKRAVVVQPELVEAYEALGVILSRHDQYDEAIQMMNHVLVLEPDHVLAHTNLSVFHMKLGDKEAAETEKAKAAMAAFSRKARESGLHFDIEAEQRKKEAALLGKITMFEDALKFSPHDPLGNFGLGSAYLELKRYSEAIAPFERTIQAQPKHSVAYLSLGKAFEGDRNFEKARDIYQRGIEIAAAKGDLMPLQEMQSRLAQLISNPSN